MPATQNIGLAKGYNAGGAITKARFVKFSGTQEVEMCDTAGEYACGVSMFSVSDSEILKGKGASIIHDGIAILEAGSDTPVIGGYAACDADGKAVLAATGDVILGVFREVPDNVDDGFEVGVLLSDGTSVVPA